MKPTTILCIAAISIFSAAWAQQPEWNNPSIYKINELAPHTIFIHYPDVKTAISLDANKTSWYLSLNTKWQLKIFENATKRNTEFSLPNFNASSWKTISIPSNLVAKGNEKVDLSNIPAEKNMVASFRKTVPIPEDWYGLQVNLHFDGVASAFYVWVNGQKVGYSESGMFGAEFNVTPFLKFGRMNTIAVEVYHYADCNRLFATDSLFGIFGNVGLYAFPNVAVQDFHLMASPDLTNNSGNIKLKLFTKKYLPDIDEKYKIEVRVLDRTKKDVIPAMLKDFNPSDLKDSLLVFENSINGVQLWEPNSKNIYTLLISINQIDGKVVEAISYRFGFRLIEFSDGRLIINNAEKDTIKKFDPLLIYDPNYYYWAGFNINEKINDSPLPADAIALIGYAINKQVVKLRNYTSIVVWKIESEADTPINTAIKGWIIQADQSRPIR